jgi:hypothetical protein
MRAMVYRGLYRIRVEEKDMPPMVADRLAARRGPSRGAQHASLRPGRHSHVGPAPERPT